MDFSQQSVFRTVPEEGFRLESSVAALPPPSQDFFEPVDFNADDLIADDALAG
jgi:hypothetical protein